MRDVVAMENDTSGGTIDTEVNELAAMPTVRPSTSVVTIWRPRPDRAISSSPSESGSLRGMNVNDHEHLVRGLPAARRRLARCAPNRPSSPASGTRLRDSWR
ncbi:hypothetical protein OG943_09935 [Amycolatopsis sp. NBC_00345]|uniref:hypothetical protein n=1 Tax=Amycolatopsis sp. NBC_00345 TaxID=2975955 RepID=UPI002E25BEDA